VITQLVLVSGNVTLESTTITVVQPPTSGNRSVILVQGSVNLTGGHLVVVPTSLDPVTVISGNGDSGF